MYDFDIIVDRRHTNSEKWHVQQDELPMWIADMDFPTAPAVREALAQRVAHGIFGYTGIPNEWYAAYQGWWERRHHWKLEPDWLIFASGVVPTLSAVVRKLTTPAEKVLVQTPVYNIFFNSIMDNGRIPVESPLTWTEAGYVMDFARLEQDLADPQVTLMLLCNPQNPGGVIWSKETLARLAELCAKYGVTVVADEIHGDITDPGCEYVPLASVSETARNISVTCMSPSKAFNIAGLHSACVSVPNPLLRHKVWRGLNTDEVAEPNAFAIVAAVAALTQGDAWLEALREYLYRNKQYLLDYLKTRIPELRPTPGTATYLQWLDGRALKNAGQGFTDFLRRETGLCLSDGRQYGANGAGFMRLNYACPRSTLVDGLQRLEAGVKRYQETF